MQEISSRDKSQKFDCDVAENCLKEKRNKKSFNEIVKTFIIGLNYHL